MNKEEQKEIRVATIKVVIVVGIVAAAILTILITKANG